MKKKIAALAVALFVFASVEAFSFGIGVRGGYGWGSIGNGGLLFSPNSALHFGLNYYIKDGVSLGLTADYWVIEKNLTSISNGSLGAYAGIGFFGDINAYKDIFDLYAGIRIPIGLVFNFEFVDVFLEIDPQLGLTFLPGIAVYGWLGGAIGLRFWID